MNGSLDLDGVHESVSVFDLERARLPDRPDFSSTMGFCDAR